MVSFSSILHLVVLKIYYFIFNYASLRVCVCMHTHMHVGTHRDQKKAPDPLELEL